MSDEPNWALFNSVQADSEMQEGYRDGFDLNSPAPSANRSHSYRHGFANGRDDRSGKPRATFNELLAQAVTAMDADARA